jgi:hypothetical protein
MRLRRCGTGSSTFRARRRRSTSTRRIVNRRGEMAGASPTKGRRHARSQARSVGRAAPSGDASRSSPLCDIHSCEGATGRAIETMIGQAISGVRHAVTVRSLKVPHRFVSTLSPQPSRELSCREGR